MQPIVFDYAWRTLEGQGIEAAPAQWSCRELSGWKVCEEAIRSISQPKGRDVFLSLLAISSFDDFISALRHAQQNDPDMDATPWTQDGYASYRLLLMRRNYAPIPKYSFCEDWNPFFLFRIKCEPSMKLFDAREAIPFSDAIHRHFSEGKIVVWEECLSAIVIYKQGHRFRGHIVQNLGQKES